MSILFDAYAFVIWFLISTYIHVYVCMYRCTPYVSIMCSFMCSLIALYGRFCACKCSGYFRVQALGPNTSAHKQSEPSAKI